MKLLSDITENIEILESHGNVEVSVSSVTLNSKEIEPNSLFVALIGNVVDGHIFINDCIKAKATVIVHEKDLKEYKEGVTYLKVPDTHQALGIISSNFYGNPSEKLKLVGVTGTNGKTTTVTLLHQLFSKLGYKAGMIGTVVNKINAKSYEAIRTTPDAVSLNKLMREMVDEGCQYCFMEVSSHSVCEKRIAGLSFLGGIFTNLTHDHLDYHKTIENYCEAKKTFFDILPSYGFVVSNIDDDKGEYMLSGTLAHPYTLSLKKKADFNEKIESKLIGEFNDYNILGIYAVAVLLGQDKEKVKEIIKKLDSVPGRFEYLKSKSGITGIVDYAHTPDALSNVLKTINEMKKILHTQSGISTPGVENFKASKIITVIGCGGDRDKSKRPIMARIGYEMSDLLILTSDNPRSEIPEDILNDMQKGLPLDHDDKVEIIVDRHLAIMKACEIAKDGDYVLVAGKGHEKYQEINGLKTYFDDMEQLEKYLK